MSEPASVSYFTPTFYEAADPSRAGDRQCVTVVGGGPVGLLTALGLAHRGVQVTILERKNRVGLGSKAAALTSRSLEILAAVGADGPFLEQGLPWDSGRSFYRGREISRFRIPRPEGRQHPSLINLPQPFMEQFLVDACLEHPLIDIRWEWAFAGLRQDADGCALAVDAPSGRRTVRTDWVVAADGARSPVRAALGQPLEGVTYTNSFVICDLRMTASRGTERLCWFDPPAFPGRTVLLHQLAPDLWRIDYQVSELEDLDEAIDPAVVAPKVAEHFAYIGEEAGWEIEWLSLYRAHARSLGSYRHGRVLFAGDAAHILPVFGVRGLNSGIADSVNLAWKLALVARGLAPEALLDTYDWEQRDFYRQNRAYADHSTLYMTPDSDGTRLVRDASLSLALVDPELEFLADPSYSTPLDWSGGPLVTDDLDAWDTGPASGGLVENLPIADGGPHVNDVLGPWFTLLCVDAAGPVPSTGLLKSVRVEPGGPLGRHLGGLQGSAYLLRPDRHVLRRWTSLEACDWEEHLIGMGILNGVKEDGR
ncbi:FAD-dependent oxidoreductase [Actinomadura nitritigenes]|uniref:FAD-dependent oxidoreductase n=1 Tax=Actinomadura nitritigenes TaxID=134602 RepID=UPI003D90CDC7